MKASHASSTTSQFSQACLRKRSVLYGSSTGAFPASPLKNVNQKVTWRRHHKTGRSPASHPKALSTV